MDRWEYEYEYGMGKEKKSYMRLIETNQSKRDTLCLFFSLQLLSLASSYSTLPYLTLHTLTYTNNNIIIIYIYLSFQISVHFLLLLFTLYIR